MSDLDDKIRGIAAEQYQQWYGASLGDPFDVPNVLDRMVVEIKQAFMDAGYVDKADLKSWSYTADLFIGREWYDRFLKELPDNPDYQWNSDMLAYKALIAAAKRAANIADKPQGV